MADIRAAATAAFFAATADGPFDHQRDAYEQGYEDGAAAERARIRAEVLSTWAHYDYVSKDGLLNLLDGDQ